MFLKAVQNRRKNLQKEAITFNWMGNNITKKGLEDMLSTIDGGDGSPQELPPDEVRSNWKRLASFMKGKR